MAFQPITEIEALALTRRQLLQRVEETQAWLDRPPRSAARRAAAAECSRVLHAHLNIGAMLDSSLALVQGRRSADAGYPRSPHMATFWLVSGSKVYGSFSYSCWSGLHVRNAWVPG
jgi:hypothetical protein